MSYAFNNIFIDSFSFFNSSPSKAIKEYIFDFNPTDSLIIFSLNLSFILSMTFLQDQILNLVDNYKMKQILYKNLHKHMFQFHKLNCLSVCKQQRDITFNVFAMKFIH